MYAPQRLKTLQPPPEPSSATNEIATLLKQLLKRHSSSSDLLPPGSRPGQHGISLVRLSVTRPRHMDSQYRYPTTTRNTITAEPQHEPPKTPTTLTSSFTCNNSSMGTMTSPTSMNERPSVRSSLTQLPNPATSPAPTPTKHPSTLPSILSQPRRNIPCTHHGTIMVPTKSNHHISIPGVTKPRLNCNLRSLKDLTTHGRILFTPTQAYLITRAGSIIPLASWNHSTQAYVPASRATTDHPTTTFTLAARTIPIQKPTNCKFQIHTLKTTIPRTSSTTTSFPRPQITAPTPFPAQTEPSHVHVLRMAPAP